MIIFNILRNFRKKFFFHRPLIEVRIFSSRLINNLEEFEKAYPKLKFAPVLKSNAYGHGIVGTAKILSRKKIPFFCVDSFFEAGQLRREGIKTEILIIGFVRPEEILTSRFKKLAFAITDIEQLHLLSALERKKNICKIHLKIDTGMRRQGIPLNKIESAIKIIKRSKNIILEGIFSHLADADNRNKEFTFGQIENWNQAVKIFKNNFVNLKYFHLSATAGIRFAENISANVARLGLGLYGINMEIGEDENQDREKEIEKNLEKKLFLLPTLEMATIISAVKEISPGDKVGYNGTFVAEKKMKIATVPAGYFEGVDRRLSNLGFVKVKNVFCPIIGRVSMNITVIDVSDLENVKVGDEVILISAEPSDKNSAENIAKICGAISYEILIHISSHLFRPIINNEIKKTEK